MCSQSNKVCLLSVVDNPGEGELCGILEGRYKSCGSAGQAPEDV